MNFKELKNDIHFSFLHSENYQSDTRTVLPYSEDDLGFLRIPFFGRFIKFA
jgi:hypothetical protein